MKPLINLKQFLAVLALLIIPAALLTAYFRNYNPQAGGHEHSAQAGGHAMGGQSAPMADHHGGGDAQKPPASVQTDHSKMLGATAEQAPPAEPTQAQVEASRAQLDASRAQLEASRKLLEATPDASQPQKPGQAPQPPPAAQPPGASQPPAKPAATGATPPPKATDGHDHKH